MAGSIFLLKRDGDLVEMNEQAYDSEELLQNLLATHPRLLAGDQMGDTPRRWLLIAREAGLGSDEAGTARWSVDHLFLDQDGVPTIVEVKRSTDTRIRREVVGQMLEYAANAVLYWPVDSLRELFKDTCQSKKTEPEDALRAFLGADQDQEVFWQRAGTNMEAGRVRLVFVADEVPAELRRIVDFLSAQMSPAQVYAVEIKQYTGRDLKTLVPRVFGGAGKSAVHPRPTRYWDEQSFFDELTKLRGEAEARVARRILTWATDKQLRVWWGRGVKQGSFFPLLDLQADTHWLMSVWTYGTIEVQFEMMKFRKKPPFDSDARRKELRDRLNAVPGITIPLDRIALRPTVRLSQITKDDVLEEFLKVFDWVIAEIKAQPQEATATTPQ